MGHLVTGGIAHHHHQIIASLRQVAEILWRKADAPRPRGGIHRRRIGFAIKLDGHHLIRQRQSGIAAEGLRRIRLGQIQHVVATKGGIHGNFIREVGLNTDIQRGGHAGIPRVGDHDGIGAVGHAQQIGRRDGRAPVTVGIHRGAVGFVVKGDG